MNFCTKVFLPLLAAALLCAEATQAETLDAFDITAQLAAGALVSTTTLCQLKQLAPNTDADVLQIQKNAGQASRTDLPDVGNKKPGTDDYPLGVPEPESLSMFAAGLIVLGVMTRRLFRRR